MKPSVTQRVRTAGALLHEPESIADVVRVSTPVHADARGWFSKPFQRSRFLHAGLPTNFTEQFFSHSHQGVLRGLHLQVGPSEQWKLVTCLAGKVWDTVLDLRPHSSTFQQHAAVELSATDGNSLLIPPGCAHGFLVLSEEALVGYWVSAEHDPAHDTGVRWDSAGIQWPLVADPIISSRDLALAAMQDFVLDSNYSPSDL